MLKELGIGAGTAVFLLFALYFIVKWAVRTAIEESKGEIARAVKKGIEKYERKKQEGGPEEAEFEEE